MRWSMPTAVRSIFHSLYPSTSAETWCTKSNWTPPAAPALWKSMHMGHGSYRPLGQNDPSKLWDEHETQHVDISHNEHQKKWYDIDDIRKKELEIGTFDQGGLTRDISDTGSRWVGLLSPFFFFSDLKKNYILGCISRLLAQFGHKNWTNQCLVPCGRVPILKAPHWNMRTMAIRSLKL